MNSFQIAYKAQETSFIQFEMGKRHFKIYGLFSIRKLSERYLCEIACAADLVLQGLKKLYPCPNLGTLN